jgi:hypothetical protein
MSLRLRHSVTAVTVPGVCWMLPPLWTEELQARWAFRLDPTEAPTPPPMTTTIFYISAQAFAELLNATSEAKEGAVCSRIR